MGHISWKFLSLSEDRLIMDSIGIWLVPCLKTLKFPTRGSWPKPCLLVRKPLPFSMLRILKQSKTRQTLMESMFTISMYSQTIPFPSIPLTQTSDQPCLWVPPPPQSSPQLQILSICLNSSKSKLRIFSSIPLPTSRSLILFQGWTQLWWQPQSPTWMDSSSWVARKEVLIQIRWPCQLLPTSRKAYLRKVFPWTKWRCSTLSKITMWQCHSPTSMPTPSTVSTTMPQQRIHRWQPNQQQCASSRPKLCRHC